MMITLRYMKIIYLFFSIIVFVSTQVFAETEVYFSPNGGCTNAIINEIKKAEKTIDIMMYSLSSRPIANELINAKNRGVIIRILADKGQRKQKFTSCRYLSNNSVAVRYDTGHGLMHNKVGIIDEKVLITGSFNWTGQAEKKNAENLLILTDKELIMKYHKRFEYLWNKGRE